MEWKIPNHLGAAIATLLAVSPSSPLAAQEIGDFTGTYALVAEASDDVDRAVDAATEDKNFLVRGIMRDRLRGALAPDGRIRIAMTEAGELVITADSGPVLRTPLDGTPVLWVHGNGETLEVRTEVVDGAVRQRFRGKGAEREFVYRLRPGGDVLELRATVRSERLTSPITYTLVYRRESSDVVRLSQGS